MLIGALIGFSIYSVYVMIVITYMQSVVDRHNNALGGALAQLYGKAKLNLNYGMIVIKACAFTSVGAVIGYFI